MCNNSLQLTAYMPRSLSHTGGMYAEGTPTAGLPSARARARLCVSALSGVAANGLASATFQ